MRMAVFVVSLAVASATMGCRRERLTPQDCRELLGRITDLELAERGYRDPALAARRKAELAIRLAPELAACEGRRVRPGALECARSARTAEDLSHGCLR
jgi:hypothetical protein